MGTFRKLMSESVKWARTLQTIRKESNHLYGLKIYCLNITMI